MKAKAIAIANVLLDLVVLFSSLTIIFVPLARAGVLVPIFRVTSSILVLVLFLRVKRTGLFSKTPTQIFEAHRKAGRRLLQLSALEYMAGFASTFATSLIALHL